jgi:hypothetical protein
MCTLTYLLTDIGYELFFNRDEQRSRLVAIPPKLNQARNAIYPVDPQGKGTWLAVNQQGLTMALLNYYQAPFNNNPHIVSRGQLILSLLEIKEDLIEQLKAMNLSMYQPFKLCIFPDDLTNNNNNVHCFNWTGNELFSVDIDLPITSSSIDLDEVCKKRKRRFNSIIDANTSSSSQLKNFHFSTEIIGKYSVNMQRTDAQTVSISHIVVNHDISFKYYDNILKEEHAITSVRANKLELAS